MQGSKRLTGWVDSIDMLRLSVFANFSAVRVYAPTSSNWTLVQAGST
jgi:hypothetical protein